MTGDSPPEVTGEAKVCRSCSLTIVTELAHDTGKWSLPSSSLSSSFSKSYESVPGRERRKRGKREMGREKQRKGEEGGERKKEKKTK